MLIEITEAEKELLTQTELNVVDWLNEHENRIFDLSISDIAVETYSSPATVSRAIRKCGFSGIAEMRFKASSKNNYIEMGKLQTK